MFNHLFERFGVCGGKGQNSSCDVLWIIILLMIVFRGGMFGLDICTLIILFIVFGKDFLGCGKREHHDRCC